MFKEVNLESSELELLASMRRARNRRLFFVCGVFLGLPLALLSLEYVMLVNPLWGKTARPPTVSVQISLTRLKSHVRALTGTRVPRHHATPEGLNEAARYIRGQWEGMGLKVTEQHFVVRGNQYQNVEISIGPRDGERVVVGAHYDVCKGLPGADDNASGVAGLIELSRALRASGSKLNTRFDLVAYSLEEPPFFGTLEMGSAKHAQKLAREGVKLKAMISLEMIGFFSNRRGSQRYTSLMTRLFYPDRGNFIALVGNQTRAARRLTAHLKMFMNAGSRVPVHSINSSGMLGADFSDHRNYWALGVPAVMLTDTAFLRNPNYHKASDNPDTLDFQKIAEVIRGLYWALIRFY